MIFFKSEPDAKKVCCLKSPQRNVVFYTLLPLNLYFVKKTFLNISYNLSLSRVCIAKWHHFINLEV